MTLLTLLKPKVFRQGQDAPYFEFDLNLDAPDSIVVVSEEAGRALVARLAKDPEDLRTIDRRKFEEVVAEIWRGFGYDVELTKQTRDGGRDVIAIKQREASVKFLIECKRPDPGNPVGLAVVQRLYGVKHDEQASKGIIVTTTRLTKPAQLFLDKHPWELEGHDFNGLKTWLENYAKLCGITINPIG